MIIEGGPSIEEIVNKNMPNSPAALVVPAPEHLRSSDPICLCMTEAKVYHSRTHHLLVPVPNCPYLMK